VEVTDEQPWKLVTFCVQSADDAADVSKRNKGTLHACTLHTLPRSSTRCRKAIAAPYELAHCVRMIAAAACARTYGRY